MAKLTKKSYRRKRMLMGLALFMSVALISTGFAAWVISSAVEDKGTGNVSVGVVSDKAITIVLDNRTELDNFKFEPHQNDTKGRVYNDGENFEELTVEVSGYILDPNDYLTGLTITLEEANPDGSDTYYAKENSGLFKAQEEGYIVAPEECFYTELSLYNSRDEEAPVHKQYGEDCLYETTRLIDEKDVPVKEFKYSISFKWGSKFEGINPGYYYDGLKADGTEYDEELDKDLLAIRDKGKNTSREEVISNLTLLRNLIYNKTEEVGKQDPNLNGPKYKIVVRATTE